LSHQSDYGATANEVRYRYKSIISFSILAISGLVLTVIADRLNAGWGKDALSSLADTLLVVGLLSVIYEFFLRQEILGMVRARVDRLELSITTEMKGIEKAIREENSFIQSYINLSESIKTLGLSLVAPSSSKFDYSELFNGQSTLYIVMNDGRTWASFHSASLARRFKDPSKKTVFIVIHKESPFLHVLSEKVKSTREGLQLKIAETIQNLANYAGTNVSCLEVYGHHLPTTYSLVLNDDVAVLTPYPMAEKAEDIPAYVYRNTGPDAYFASIKRDVSALLSGTKKMFPDALL